jgi:hypothetical protein
VLRKFTYPDVVCPQGKIAFTSWWENKGVAPCYKQFPLALRLKNTDREYVLVSAADIRGWLPGDNLYDDVVFVPAEMPLGRYDLDIAMLDPTTRQPKIRLAIAGRKPDGWYSLGKITVQE